MYKNLQRQIIKALKITVQSIVLQTIFASLLIANNTDTHAQNQRSSIEKIYIDVNFNHTPFKEVLKDISNKTDLNFSYEGVNIPLNKKITINASNESVANVLRKISKEARVKFRRVNGNVFVADVKKNGIGGVQEQLLEEFKISGKVSDEKGEGLPGVSVLVKGTSRGVVTDIDGNYSIVAEETATLTFSFVGYESQEVIIGSRTTIDVSLQLDVQQLDELVVVGYGTSRRSDVSGALSSVSKEDFEKQPMIDATDALQGRAAGVFVGSTNGAPGGDVKITIRGANSMTGSSSPLIVIDGVVSGGLSYINPADIASYEVLKDASATAIYGSRGANGVILVTTKQGASEAPTINFDAFFGYQEVSKKIDLLSAGQFAREVNAKDIAIGVSETYTAEEIAALDANGGTDWQDELFRTAPMQNYQLSVSGKSKNTNYYFSANYANQDGIMINTGSKRYNFRTKINTSLNDKFSIGTILNMMYLDGTNNQPRASIASPVYGSLTFDPTTPVYDADGKYNITSVKSVGSLGVNPLAEQLEQNVDRERTRNSTNFYLNYKVLDWLTVNWTGGATVTSNTDKRFNAALTGNNRASIFDSDSRLLQTTSRVTFEKEFGNHRVKVDAVHEIQDSKFEQHGMSADSTNFPSLGYNNIGTFAINQIISSWAVSNQIESILGRVNYTFRDKVVLTGTVRRDGSSKFSVNNKYAVFPSAAVAWRLSEEGFIKNLGFFDNLKIRASYGLVGNQGINSYQTLPTIKLGPTENYPYDDDEAVVGGGPDKLGNPDLKWETTAQLDLGVDMAIFEGRVDLTFDYYKKNTTDLLLNVSAPGYTGLPSQLQNVGEIENKGFELSLGATVINSGDFQWKSNINFASNETKVVSLGVDTVAFPGQTYGEGLAVGPAVILEPGQPTGNFYGYIYEGVWQTNEAAQAALYGNVPGDAKYRDIDGDNLINTNDLAVMGNGQPDFIWGFNNTFSFKGFDLNVFIQGVQGFEIWNLGRGYIFGNTGDARHATTAEISNRWSENNTSSNIPAYSTTSVNHVQSSRYVEDGSYVRFKNISLGYNVPSSLLEKSGFVRGLRVYVSGQNLITLTNYSGYDPEVSNIIDSSTSSIDQSIDWGAYPTSKSFVVGFNMTF